MTKATYPKRSSEAFARSKARQDLRDKTNRLALNAAHERREKEKSERAN